MSIRSYMCAKKRELADDDAPDAAEPAAKKLCANPTPVVLYAHSPGAALLEYDLSRGRWAELVKTVVREASPQLFKHPKLGSQCGTRDNRKDMHMNRSCGFFANPKDSYGYFFSMQLMASIPPTDAMVELMALVSELIGAKVNGVLINEYANGKEYISAHSDDERGLANTGVFAISFGAARKFRIRIKETKVIACDVPTRHMHALFMQGSEFQRDLTHEIPPQGGIDGVRRSMTFRYHLKANEKPILAKFLARNGHINGRLQVDVE